jgi:hypothetical protein
VINATATAVEVSGNKKIGRVSATYASQGSCPNDCALRGAGCYAESGRMGIITGQLNLAEDTRPIADVEAEAIDKLTGRMPLRLHVVGDCATDDAARTVRAAVDRYTKRGGGKAWTYTHAWREVERVSWGSVSVRASVERVEDIKVARERGYPAAIVVDRHESDKRYTIGGEDVVPCPEQTRGKTCEECRLCWGGNVTVAFAIHGARKNAAREAIK